MNRKDLERLADMVADRITCDDADISTQQRRLQLKNDLEALSVIFSERDQAVAEVRAQIAEHGYVEVSEIDGAPGVLVPPDFGPDGPTEDDIDREIRDILRKIRRLKNPKGEEDYEFKFSWRVQINLGLLVSILIELLELIRKLRERRPVTG